MKKRLLLLLPVFIVVGAILWINGNPLKLDSKSVYKCGAGTEYRRYYKFKGEEDDFYKAILELEAAGRVSLCAGPMGKVIFELYR